MAALPPPTTLTHHVSVLSLGPVGNQISYHLSTINKISLHPLYENRAHCRHAFDQPADRRSLPCFVP